MQLTEDTIRKFVVQELVLETIKNHNRTTPEEWSNDFQSEVIERVDEYMCMPYLELTAKFRRQLIEAHNMNTPGIAKMHLADIAAKEDPKHFGAVLYLLQQEQKMSERF